MGLLTLFAITVYTYLFQFYGKNGFNEENVYPSLLNNRAHAKYGSSPRERVNPSYQDLFPNATVQDISQINVKAPMIKCYEEIGCLSFDKEFYDLKRRPYNLMPMSREKINTTFATYTRRNSKQFVQMKANDPKSVKNADFDPSRPTVFIIPGFIDNERFAQWLKDMKDEFLVYENSNVIIVYWSGGNLPPYGQATSNTRVVGLELGYLINYLKDNHGLDMDKVHLLGHSLGAHISAYAGNACNGTIARITGMDPAGPFFEGMPPIVRLDPTDAKFVDVIHSDATNTFNLGFGTRQLLGHVDFFPDDGQDHPGCETVSATMDSLILEGVGEGARRFASCDHQRSVDFMIDSINNEQCTMVGYACEDWDTFLAGKCADCGDNSEKCAILGLRAIDQEQRLPRFSNGTTVPTMFYMKTNKKSPFCLFHYQVTLKLSNKCDENTGKLYLTLVGSKREEKFQIGSVTDMHPGETYTFLITTPNEIGAVGAIKIDWVKTLLGMPTWNTRAKIILDFVRIVPMNSADKKVQEANTGMFCKSNPDPIYARYPMTLVRVSPEDCEV